MLKNNLLLHFLNKSNESFTLNQLAQKFDVSRNACWKAINALSDDGVIFKNDRKTGYQYVGSKIINKEIVNFHSSHFQCVEAFEIIPSTSTYIKSMESVKHLDTVMARCQSSGRGRRGKDFLSAKDRGIYFSFYYEIEVDISESVYITVCSALAVKRAVKKLYNLDLDVKWLNDLYYNNKKISGILTEVTLMAETQQLSGFYVGIGFNILEVSDDIKSFAIGLEEIVDTKIDRNELIGTILNECYEIFDQIFVQNQKELIMEEYQNSLFIIGKTVHVENKNEEFDCKVLGINERAELVVLKDDEELTLNNAYVSIKLGDNNEDA